jgi:hypothetical protein
MRKIILGISIVTLIALAVMVSAHTEDDPFVTTLMAGQHIEVGEVSVWNDSDNLYVEYTTECCWELIGTHLYVGKNDPEELTSSPGQFPYSDNNPYVIPLSEIDSYSMELNKKGKPTGKLVADGDPGVEPCDDIYIAAHAVVQKTTVINPTPYYASAVVSYEQGLKKDGTPVRWQRSTPEQGLAFESGQSEFNFFSLGFGGWIIVEFDCPIQNGEGNDIKVIEDTWGSYPLEKADVYASQDGTTWTYLGEADNTTRDVMGIHSISEFDLGSLEWATYIKIVDTTDPAVHNNSADGYDLNAVEALHDCVEVQEETAWGDEGAVPFGTNWAMYFIYHVQYPVIRWPEQGTAYIGYEDRKAGDFDYNDFGMNMYVQETYVGNCLSEIDMEFEALTRLAGDRHDIHILRTLSGSTDYDYTITRTAPAQGTETPAGSGSDSGNFDIVLFDSNYHYTLGNIVTIHIDITAGCEIYNPAPTAPRWDLDPVFAYYDPWMYDRSISAARHIGDWQAATTKLPTQGYNVPYIITIPVTNWPAPAEAVTITGPYPEFDDYYRTQDPMYENWYE